MNESTGPRSVAVGRNDGVVATGDHARITQVQAIPFPPPSQVSPGKRIVGLPRPPTEVFVGRDGAYDRLAETLSARTGVVVTQALHGLGGVGKSELALQYAHRQREKHPVVWWITADSPAHLETGLAELAQRLLPGTAKAATTEDAAAWTIEWLQAHPGWLLVLDNVTDPTHIEQLLGSVEGGHVLITSRRDIRWPGTTTTLLLEVLTSESAATLITEITGRDAPEDQEAAEAIAAELGFLPLALDQAAAYIRQTHITPARYLRRLREYPARLYETPAHGDKAQATIARLWDITIGTLTETAPEAVDLLKILAWYAPDDIPRFMLSGEEDDEEDEEEGEELADDIDETLGVVVSHSMITLADGIDEALGVLASHSMITLTDETVSLHRLTRAVLLTWPSAEAGSDQGDDRTCERALFWLVKAMPPNPDTEVTEWPIWRALTAHIDAITAHALPSRLHRAAEVALVQMASFLMAQGEYQRAETKLETAVTLGEKTLGPDHPEMSIRMGNLAVVYRHQGRYSDALSLEERALAIAEKTLGPDHSHTATLVEGIAVTYGSLDRHSDALPMFRRALSIREKEHAPDPHSLAIALDNLATCYSHLGRGTRAIPLHKRALAIAEKALGPEHFTVARCLSNLAVTYGSLDRYSDALPLEERALAITEKTLGPGHPEMVLRLMNLSSTYFVLGRYSDALVTAKRAVVCALNSFGAHHPTTEDARAFRRGLIVNLADRRAMPE